MRAVLARRNGLPLSPFLEIAQHILTFGELLGGSRHRQGGGLLTFTLFLFSCTCVNETWQGGGWMCVSEYALTFA